MKNIFLSCANQSLRLLFAATFFTTPIFGQIKLPETVNDSNSQSCMARVYYHINEDMITVGDSLQPDSNLIAIHEFTNYEWDFGDGTSSNFPTVSHEYQASGEYEITLHKSYFYTLGRTYCKKKYSFKVNIKVDYCKPKIRHYSKNNIQYFVARGKKAVTSFTWRIGNSIMEGDSVWYRNRYESDGRREVCVRTSSTYPIYNTQIAGTCVSDTCFFINIIDTSQTCISDILVTKKAYKTYQFFDTLSWLQGRPIIINIDVKSPADTIRKILYPCDPAPLSATYWVWDFGDGVKDINPKAAHKYQKAGKYKASLTKYHYEYFLWCNNNCTKYDSTLMMITPCLNKPKCSETKYFDVVVDSVGCRADFTYKWLGANKMLFTDISQYSNGSDSTIWDFGDGAKAIGKQVVHAFQLRPKEYKVCMNIKANGCITDGICGECMLTQCRRIVMDGKDTIIPCERQIVAENIDKRDSNYVSFDRYMVSLKLSPVGFYIDNGWGKSTSIGTTGIWYIGADTIVRPDSYGFNYSFPKEGTYPICVDYKIVRSECTGQECIKSIVCQNRICDNIKVTAKDIYLLNYNQKLQQLMLKTTLYPNPAKENVTVEVIGLDSPFDLTIYNNAGSMVKKVTNMTQTNNIFSAKDMNTGLYFYTIYSEGRIISKDKFLVE